MTDCITLPREVITKLWMTPDALQLFAYLLHIADKNGDVNIDMSHISNDIRQSCNRVESGLAILRNLSIISRKSSKRIHLYLTLGDTPSKPNGEELIHLPTDDFASFADTFNRKVKGTSIPQIRGLSDSRKKSLISRAKECGGLNALENILDRVVASDFLSGRKTDFCASFDWIFKKANFIKILEGNYDNKSTSTPQRTIDGRQIDRYSALAAAARSVIRRDTTVYPPEYD